MKRGFRTQPIGKTDEQPQPSEKKNGGKKGKTTPEPPKEEVPMEKVRYSDEELQEFKELILVKLTAAETEYQQLKASITHSSSNGTEDTSPTFKVLEEGASTLSKEEAGQLAQRQFKFIRSLQAALIRIENKSYGICSETGKLISKERLRIVPNASKSVEGKAAEKRKEEEKVRQQILASFQRSTPKKSGYY